MEAHFSEEIRELATEQRHHDEHLRHNMLTRALEPEESVPAEQVREHVIDQRLHAENLEENLLERAEEQLSGP